MNIKQKLTYAILGFLVGNAVLLAIFFGYNPIKNPGTSAQEIQFDQAVQLLKSEKIKKVNFSNLEVTLTDSKDKKYFATIGNDSTREVLLNEISNYNSNSSNPIKLSVEAQGSGFGWLILINLVPLIFGVTIIGLLIAILLKLNKNQPLN